MRHLAALFLVASLGVGAAHAEEITGSHKAWPIAQRLIANERNAWATYSRRDVAANGRLLAPDYRDVQGDGSVLDRAGHLAFVPEANLESHTLDQFHAFLLSPDAALVTYRARARDKGSPEIYEAAVTSGWARRNGEWVSVFYRETPTQAEPAGAAAN